MSSTRRKKKVEKEEAPPPPKKSFLCCCGGVVEAVQEVELTVKAAGKSPPLELSHGYANEENEARGMAAPKSGLFEVVNKNRQGEIIGVLVAVNAEELVVKGRDPNGYVDTNISLMPEQTVMHGKFDEEPSFLQVALFYGCKYKSMEKARAGTVRDNFEFVKARSSWLRGASWPRRRPHPICTDRLAAPKRQGLTGVDACHGLRRSPQAAPRVNGVPASPPRTGVPGSLPQQERAAQVQKGRPGAAEGRERQRHRQGDGQARVCGRRRRHEDQHQRAAAAPPAVRLCGAVGKDGAGAFNVF
jgi:hypothetical protein